jgi:hypothetical protein
LTLTAVRADPRSGLTISASPGADGTVSVAIGNAASGSASGVLALFDFQAAGSVPAGSSLALDLSATGLDGSISADAGGSDAAAAVPSAGSPLVSMRLVSATDATTAATNPTRLAQALLLGGEAA